MGYENFICHECGNWELPHSDMNLTLGTCNE